MKAYDFKVNVGDLVRHNSYKDMLGIVYKIDLYFAGSPVAVAWTSNKYGLGYNSVHHPDRLEVIRESR